jgi:hypothetical protein
MTLILDRWAGTETHEVPLHLHNNAVLLKVLDLKAKTLPGRREGVLHLISTAYPKIPRCAVIYDLPLRIHPGAQIS